MTGQKELSRGGKRNENPLICSDLCTGFKRFWSSLSSVLIIFTLMSPNAIFMQENAKELLYLRL